MYFDLKFLFLLALGSSLLFSEVNSFCSGGLSGATMNLRKYVSPSLTDRPARRDDNEYYDEEDEEFYYEEYERPRRRGRDKELSVMI